MSPLPPLDWSSPSNLGSAAGSWSTSRSAGQVPGELTDRVPERAASRPRVLHVVDTEEYAGRESVVESLARGQMEAGYDVLVACVVEGSVGEPPFLKAARNSGIPIEVVRLRPRAYLQEWRELVELIRRIDPDVVHTHGYRPDVVAGAAAEWTNTASVSTVHGFIQGGWKNRLYLRLQRFALRRFDAVVAVSGGVADELERHGVGGAVLHVIPNAWDGRDDFLPRYDARRTLSVENNEFLVGWVGRVSREKGLDVLLDALVQLERGAVSLSVVGDGPERELLEGKAGDLPASVRVRWHGTVSSAYRLFPAFDAFVLSSRTEGTPMVLLEAMAAGVPIVATAVGGVPNVVSDDEALLVPPEDPEALAAAVSQVRDRPEEAASRARAAGHRLESEYSLTPWVDRYRDVYRRALSSGDRECRR